MDWLEQEVERPYHPVAALFPLLEGPEFEELKADIAVHGLLEAIWLHPDGSIIDGRNRHRACIETETRPEFRTWDDGRSLVSFVVSMNLHRRHLSSSQRAAISLDVLPMLEEEAKARQGTRTDISQTFDESERGRSDEHAAALFQTNRQYVSDAKVLKDQAPDLLDEVRAGSKSIPQARRELTRRQKQDPPPFPSDKYRVIYADPPWEYGNSGIIGESDHYGHVERHYPSMGLSEICGMGQDIRDLADTDAVLFLWAPSPLLEDAFKVIRAWGFEYKTSFVWDKVRHNFGHYNSVRHEFLLVCTRGSCTPDHLKLYDSVQTIERSGVHSEKPEELRNIIDDLYQYGRRIELFARCGVENWDHWGNEAI